MEIKHSSEALGAAIVTNASRRPRDESKRSETRRVESTFLSMNGIIQTKTKLSAHTTHFDVKHIRSGVGHVCDRAMCAHCVEA